VSADSATTARRPPGFISRTTVTIEWTRTTRMSCLPASYQISKNPRIQADFVIRHRQVVLGHIPLTEGLLNGLHGYKEFTRMFGQRNELMVQVEATGRLIDGFCDNPHRGNLRAILPTPMKSVHQQ